MDGIVFVIKDAAFLLMLLIGVIMLPILLVGLTVGIFQAATQIQEMTLSFIPKLIVLVLVLLFGSSFLGNAWISFCHSLFQVIQNL